MASNKKKRKQPSFKESKSFKDRSAWARKTGFAGGSLPSGAPGSKRTFREVSERDKETRRTAINKFRAGRIARGSKEKLLGEGDPLPVGLPRGSFSALSNKDKAKLVTAEEFYGDINKVPPSQVGSYFTREELEAKREGEDIDIAQIIEDRAKREETREGNIRGDLPLTEEERAGLSDEEIAQFEGPKESIAGKAGEVTPGDVMGVTGAGKVAGAIVKGVGKVSTSIAAKKSGDIAVVKAKEAAYKAAQKEISRKKIVEKAINDMGMTEKQAEIHAKNVLTIKAPKLLTKMKKLAMSKTAVRGFIGAAGLQWALYWGASDNLSGTASQDSTNLMNTIKFGIPVEGTGEKIFMTAEEIEERKAEIMIKQNSAETSARYGAWINPVTGWPMSKFYGAIIKGNRETIEFNFDLIDQMSGQV